MSHHRVDRGGVHNQHLFGTLGTARDVAVLGNTSTGPDNSFLPKPFVSCLALFAFLEGRFAEDVKEEEEEEEEEEDLLAVNGRSRHRRLV